jgi:hypothetical protein
MAVGKNDDMTPGRPSLCFPLPNSTSNYSTFAQGMLDGLVWQWEQQQQRTKPTLPRPMPFRISPVLQAISITFDRAVVRYSIFTHAAHLILSPWSRI